MRVGTGALLRRRTRSFVAGSPSMDMRGGGAADGASDAAGAALSGGAALPPGAALAPVEPPVGEHAPRAAASTRSNARIDRRTMRETSLSAVAHRFDAAARAVSRKDAFV